MEEYAAKVDTELQERQIQVRFTTKLKEEFRVVNTPFAVPSTLSRYGLSEVINALLRLEKPVPFDFLLDGELIRTTLEKLLLSKNLSTETVLRIEYIPAILPPSVEQSQSHDHWVSAVDGSVDRFVITGSYDHAARVWNAEGTCVRVLGGHSDAIKSLCVIPDAESPSKRFSVFTASRDRTLRMWQVPVEDLSSQESLQSTKCFKGHKYSVQSVSASPSGKLICSGSWDCSIKIWSTVDENLGTDEEVIKKRKLGGSEGHVHNVESVVSAGTTFEGHTNCVSGVAWAAEHQLYSTSWDNSLRSWNVETGVNTGMMSCSKALFCLTVGGEGAALIAAGGADNVLRIWDPRIVGVVAPVMQLTSHKLWITSCRWHPRSSHHLISSSHDGSVKLWDVRGKVPLHTLEAHEDKVLCADWWREDWIVSGGADSKLKMVQNVRIPF